ncbi:MAG: hypothetical protein IT349_09170 [Candidatus Eisenbacteria bacterium]|nr:hypothetical protein [Candidatus Eisenbacteria bacterium]
MGGSIGHPKVTAGTLGCFAAFLDGEAPSPLILSNNHVLANENSAEAGDITLQPGRVDGGKVAHDRVGALTRFVRLKKTGNLVDAAVSAIDPGLWYYPNWMKGTQVLSGVRKNPAREGEVVRKVGRTTGVTVGRIRAVELDPAVTYDLGRLRFVNQIEIEPIGNQPFSLGGDSGSLIVDEKGRALGLLFAGNDTDTTYANPISTVLESLQIRLVF